MKEAGKVIHYFKNINVGVIALSGALSVGDSIKIKGMTTDFDQKVDSMQIDKNKIEKGKKGQEIAIKVSGQVRKGDIVYKV